jgi:hypothetical protein
MITKLVWPLLTLLIDEDGPKSAESFVKKCHQAMWQLAAVAESCAKASSKKGAPSM